MKKLFLVSACIWLLAACVGTQPTADNDHAELVEFGADKVEVKIETKEWGGIFGIHGFVGYQHEEYVATLVGKGPMFTNPEFLDNPPTNRCIGTITLDRQHSRVTVNMWRIISEPGEPEKTELHPANGTYPIQSIRQASPLEY
jgi:hypothetical protein